MNVEEVFCPDCYQWKKRKDLVETQYSDKALFCAECGEVLVRLEGYGAEEVEGVKLFVINGFQDGGFVFSFSVSAINSCEAMKLISNDELIRDMEFDRLVIKELTE